jgi:hypothetical protein
LVNPESSTRFNFDGESKNIYFSNIYNQENMKHRDATDDAIVIETKLEATKSFGFN